jgi:hypothetical protein
MNTNYFRIPADLGAVPGAPSTEGAITQTAAALHFPDGTCCDAAMPWGPPNVFLALDHSNEKFCNVTVSDNLESAAKNLGATTCLLRGIPEKLRPSFNYATWAQAAQQNGDIWIIKLCENAVAMFYKKTDECNRCALTKRNDEDEATSCCHTSCCYKS